MNTQEIKKIQTAIKILDSHLKTKGDAYTNVHKVKTFLRLHLETLEHEVFSIMFLDNKHKLIEFQKMFRGTIDGATVHTREIIKEALKLNAAALIISHNHLSGDPFPSLSDKHITQRIKDTLELVDMRLLDHIIVGANQTLSFSEQGMM